MFFPLYRMFIIDRFLYIARVTPIFDHPTLVNGSAVSEHLRVLQIAMKLIVSMVVAVEKSNFNRVIE